MNRSEKFSKKYLSREILEVQRSKRLYELLQLSIYEKAIIYKYSEDGYEDVNELLRSSKGTKTNLFAEVLNNSLSKLDNYEGIVFRCTDLNSYELSRYHEAKAGGYPLVEYAFLSTTKSELIAASFSKGKGTRTKFVIYSKTGKEIEKITKFGIHNPPNEKEVIFNSGKHFNILEMAEDAGFLVITMKEV